MGLFDKEKRMISITCILSLLTLLLPFVNTTLELSKTYSRSMIGLVAAGKSIIGLVLIVGPVLLLASNCVKDLEKYNATLSKAVPVICIVVLLIVKFAAKSFCIPETNKLTSALIEGGHDVDIKSHLSIGGILALLTYIATFVFAVGKKETK